MSPWLRVLEAYLVQALLRSPAFHRGVEKVAKQVHRVRHGIPPEELGGTKIDGPKDSSFLQHFNEEIQVQLGRAERKAGSAVENASEAAGQSPRVQTAQAAEEENAEAVWAKAQRFSSEGPKQGFMGEYIGALREQVRGGK